ncbi:MAG: methyltransferase domain-containing protein [Bacteroidota bacterium]
MIKNPVAHRNGIPFYHAKTEEEFRLDLYEDYGQMVVRQLDLHFGHTPYPWQKVDNWIASNVVFTKNGEGKTLVEVGCGLGCQIARLASSHPKCQAYGFDYSYQMLKIANDYWCRERPLNWLSQRGWGERAKSKVAPAQNLHFGLAKATNLPLPDQKVDLIFSCFLFDRLQHPERALIEWHRLLKPGGQLLVISPLNYPHKGHWENWFPIKKLIEQTSQYGFDLVVSDQLDVQEPMDVNGNQISWAVSCLHLVKGA